MFSSLSTYMYCIYMYARTKFEPEVFGGSIFNRNLAANRPQPHRLSYDQYVIYRYQHVSFLRKNR